MWQEQQGKAIFRIQTVNMDIHLYLLQKKEFEIVGEGVNVEVWIHRAEFPSIKQARRILESMANENESLSLAVSHALRFRET